MRTAIVLGSPKDADRLPEVLGYVLTGYRQRIKAAEDEVARMLEGLILDWWDSFDHYAPSAALEAEAKRIRAAKGESVTSSKSKDNL